jgi:hypothetical protein
MTQEQTVLRTGGICAMLGALITLVAIMLGPLDLDAQDTAVMITYFADNAGRLQVHGLGVALGKLLLLGGFVALYTSLRDSGWAGMGLAAGVAATVVNIIGPMFGGGVLPAIGQAYEQLPAGETAAALHAAQGFYYLYEALLGPSLLTMAAALLPFALAIVQADRYPRWLGWLAGFIGLWLLVGGAAFFLVGPARAAGIMNFFAPGFMLSFVWLFIVGFFLWRLAGVTEPASKRQRRSTTG